MLFRALVLLSLPKLATAKCSPAEQVCGEHCCCVTCTCHEGPYRCEDMWGKPTDPVGNVNDERFVSREWSENMLREHQERHAAWIEEHKEKHAEREAKRKEKRAARRAARLADPNGTKADLEDDEFDMEHMYDMKSDRIEKLKKQFAMAGKRARMPYMDKYMDKYMENSDDSGHLDEDQDSDYHEEMRRLKKRQRRHREEEHGEHEDLR